MIIVPDAAAPGTPPDVRDIEGWRAALIYPFAGGCD
jgi:hypothetical protein